MFNDPTPLHLRRLAPAMQALAFQFINDLRGAGIPAYISSSTRTIEEQRRLVKAGRSKTYNSRHLTGRAFDYDVLGWSRDKLPRDWMLTVGEYGESLGMKWGGRFTGFYDGGHFEI